MWRINTKNIKGEQMNNSNFFATKAGKAVIIILGYLIIFGLIMLCINIEVGMPIIAVISIFFGWRFLNRITPDMFLFLSCTGWIVYFMVKLFLSAAVGLFVAPFHIARLIANIVSDTVSNNE